MLVLWLVAAPVLARAQTPGDSLGSDSERVQLRQMVRERWRAHIRQNLSLTDDQAAKLFATEDRFEAARRPLQQRLGGIARDLNQQLQPGVAANGDAVTRLMNEREDNRLKLEQIDRDEDREMAGYLTPVQRARYQRQRQVFRERIRDLMWHRAQQRGMGPSGGPPQRRPRRRP
jgi:Spy/CpxP family protein refolding chaperone